MSHRVRCHLRLEINHYDEAIRRFIPGYETMITEAASAVAATRPDHVLDLGAGTGGLSLELLRRDEVKFVELLDVDPEMLDQARSRLAGYENRSRFTLASFEEPLPGCDAVASSLALHHIPTIEAKQVVYRRVFEALRQGGLFVNADATIPEQPEARRAVFRGWADHMVAHGISEERAWQHFEEWAEEDIYFPVERELAALRAAGFEASCDWHQGPISLVVGRKPCS